MIKQKPMVMVPESELDRKKIEKIERYARVCYKSEEKMAKGVPNTPFLHSILSRGHESVIEHEKISVLFIIDRGISHEMVRHRIAAYSQESTRYCNYSKDKFGGEITVIEPFFFEKNTEAYGCWEEACLAAEKNYLKLLDQGFSAQQARSVLPNSLKTEIVVTYNMREWRHFFRLRSDAAAHPQMRQVAIPLLLTFQERFPEIFGDLAYDRSFPREHYAEIIMTDDLFNIV
ncbi:MAG: FAD-dependent thymidylate synthase [Syntrophomonadaceae bacterium]|jgi:thymidylate synthase (FAD)